MDREELIERLLPFIHLPSEWPEDVSEIYRENREYGFNVARKLARRKYAEHAVDAILEYLSEIEKSEK
ncbi:MAG TPA: hypothetical protein VHK27_05030 [Gammaproteobacteria bacterium]|nr:hypothetical protein [Gammaproteobacteria bacterium]